MDLGMTHKNRVLHVIRDLYVSGAALLLMTCIVCFADNTLSVLEHRH